MRLKRLLALVGALALFAPAARAEAALVAVAANFAEAAAALGAAYEAESGHDLTFVLGATGGLYAQIFNGAPFDVFLSADEARPARLEAEGRAVAGSRFTYATGVLTLFTADPALADRLGPALLAAGEFDHIAIANPETAPYGRAAMQVIAGLGLAEAVRDRIVTGQNVGQVFAMTASGAAALGFIAKSSLIAPGYPGEGGTWDPPAALHDPIRQDAVLLVRAAENAAARGFLDFLRSPAGRARIRAFGYVAD